MKSRGEKIEDSSTLIAMETTSEINYGSTTKVSAVHSPQTRKFKQHPEAVVPPGVLLESLLFKLDIILAELKVFVRLTHQLRSEGRRFILTKTEESFVSVKSRTSGCLSFAPEF